MILTKLDGLRLDVQVLRNENNELRAAVQKLTEDSSDYLTVTQFAEKVNLSREAVRQKIYQGLIEAVQIGEARTRHLIPTSEVIRFRDQAKRNHFSKKQ